MHLPSWRRKTTDFEGLLRAARPEPRAGFRDELVAMIGRAPRPTRRGVLHRTVLAGAFTTLVLAGLAAGGGIGYAAHLVSSSVVEVKAHVLDIQTTSAPSVRRNSAAIAQYGGGGGTSSSPTPPTPPPPPPPPCPAPNIKIDGNLWSIVETGGTYGVDPASSSYYATCDFYVGQPTGATLSDLRGNNTVYLTGEGNQVTTGPGSDIITLVGINNHIRDAGDGDNNIHLVGSGGVRTSAGNSAFRLYGAGKKAVVALGPGHSDIKTFAGSGSISVGPGGSSVTTSGGHYTINVANGSTDTVNCGSLKETVIKDAGDTLIHCRGSDVTVK